MGYLSKDLTEYWFPPNYKKSRNKLCNDNNILKERMQLLKVMNKIEYSKYYHLSHNKKLTFEFIIKNYNKIFKLGLLKFNNKISNEIKENLKGYMTLKNV